MVAKIGLTTDSLRSLRGGMETSADESSWWKKFTLAINSSAAAVAMFFISPLGLRLNVVNRLMTNKTFAETFKDGQFLQLHTDHSARYVKATASPENFRDILPNTWNHFKISFGLAKELKTGGVTWGNSFVRGLSSLEKISVVFTSLTAVFLLGVTVRNYFKKPAPLPEGTVIAIKPKEAADIAPILDEMKQRGLDAAVETQEQDGTVTRMNLAKNNPAASIAAHKPEGTMAGRIAAEKNNEPAAAQK